MNFTGNIILPFDKHVFLEVSSFPESIQKDWIIPLSYKIYVHVLKDFFVKILLCRKISWMIQYMILLCMYCATYNVSYEYEYTITSFP